MAFDAYDDYEQSERVQKWLRQNGLSIVVGIVIGLIGIFGYQQWRNHQASHQAAASGLYQQLQAVIDNGNTAASDALVQQLMNDYAESPYALFAVSDRARRQVEAKDYDKALDSLAWAEQHASSPSLKALVELRMAHVQFAKGDAKEALAALDRMPPDSYTIVSQELRGDVLVKLGRPDDALKAYQAAVKAMGPEAQQGNEVQMKIDDLATAGKQGA
ncbi:tetratricopeptide repeat protein [Dyella dinghuensis]|uniref:Ancillary SecYEG translocon subunit n=1 Tax=Dyella dinghuensis TaxID=1920169 RepID=A0A3S0RGI0_9GAMM|nr:tetratricopeptide repeat protein [Dyella dinghuensis]RUL66769.1 tetratricopeptide repeat protein [Dyella dinghuensis]